MSCIHERGPQQVTLSTYTTVPAKVHKHNHEQEENNEKARQVVGTVQKLQNRQNQGI